MPWQASDSLDFFLLFIKKCYVSDHLTASNKIIASEVWLKKIDLSISPEAVTCLFVIMDVCSVTSI